LWEGKSNAFNKSQSPFPYTNDDETGSTEFTLNIERSIMTLLASVKNTIHGVILANVSAKDFKINVQCTPDPHLPTCFVQCVCDYRISLY
jgi:hypothetical protein